MNFKLYTKKLILYCFDKLKHSFWIVFSYLYQSKKDFIIITFYADYNGGNRYFNSAMKLQKNLSKWRLPYDIIGIKDKGGYRSNSLFKPEFIYSKLIQHEKKIIWIDCDTELTSPAPIWRVYFSQSNIVLVSKTENLDNSMGGLLSFAYTTESFKVLRDWWLHCNYANLNNISELDHDALKHAILPRYISSFKIDFVKMTSKEIGFKSSSAVDLRIEELHFKTSQIDKIRNSIHENIIEKDALIDTDESLDILIDNVKTFKCNYNINLRYDLNYNLLKSKLKYLKLIIGDN